MQTKRKFLIAVIVLVAAVILMAGTFAWQQMASKLNEFIGHKTGITGRDDFNPKTGMKDVYVENNGETEVFVRIKLKERMDLTKNTNITDPWQAHIYESSPADCGHLNSANKYFHDYFTWEMGGQKWYMPSDGSSPIVQDTGIYNSSTPGAKQTPAVQFIKAADYLSLSAAAQEAFVGWIYDTDGYAYWSQPLAKDEATGLLLHKVNTDSSLKGTEYYYAIDVIFEAVDIEDIPMWTQGAPSVDGSGATFPEATATGKAVINKIASFATQPEEDDEDDEDEADEIDEIIDFDADIDEESEETEEINEAAEPEESEESEESEVTDEINDTDNEPESEENSEDTAETVIEEEENNDGETAEADGTPEEAEED